MTIMFVVCGFPGSGKSTVSRALTELTGIVCLREDDLKVVLSNNGVAVGRPISVFYDLARCVLRDGANVILDACFNFDEDVDRLGELAGLVAGQTIVVECVAPSALRISRMRERARHPAHGVADRVSIEQANQVTFDYTRLPGTSHITVDTAGPWEATQGRLLRALDAVPPWQTFPAEGRRASPQR